VSNIINKNYFYCKLFLFIVYSIRGESKHILHTFMDITVNGKFCFINCAEKLQNHYCSVINVSGNVTLLWPWRWKLLYTHWFLLWILQLVVSKINIFIKPNMWIWPTLYKIVY